MRAFKVGDLVVVVRAQRCCGSTAWLGQIFTVSGFSIGETLCGACSKSLGICEGVQAGRLGGFYDPSTLKKIDPLPESETIDHGEELTA